MDANRNLADTLYTEWSSHMWCYNHLFRFAFRERHALSVGWERLNQADGDYTNLNQLYGDGHALWRKAVLIAQTLKVNLPGTDPNHGMFIS